MITSVLVTPKLVKACLPRRWLLRPRDPEEVGRAKVAAVAAAAINGDRRRDERGEIDLCSTNGDQIPGQLWTNEKARKILSLVLILNFYRRRLQRRLQRNGEKFSTTVRCGVVEVLDTRRHVCSVEAAMMMLSWLPRYNNFTRWHRQQKHRKKPFMDHGSKHPELENVP